MHFETSISADCSLIRIKPFDPNLDENSKLRMESLITGLVMKGGNLTRRSATKLDKDVSLSRADVARINCRNKHFTTRTKISSASICRTLQFLESIPTKARCLMLTPKRWNWTDSAKFRTYSSPSESR